MGSGAVWYLERVAALPLISAIVICTLGGFRLPGGFTKDVEVCGRPGRRGEFATDADNVDIRVLDDGFDAYRMHTPS